MLSHQRVHPFFRGGVSELEPLPPGRPHILNQIQRVSRVVSEAKEFSLGVHPDRFGFENGGEHVFVDARETTHKGEKTEERRYILAIMGQDARLFMRGDLHEFSDRVACARSAADEGGNLFVQFPVVTAQRVEPGGDLLKRVDELGYCHDAYVSRRRRRYAESA